jgi:hypothetical protein
MKMKFDWRHWLLVALVLAVLVAIGIFVFIDLRQRVSRLGQEELKAEQSARAVPQVAITTPTDETVQAHMYWLSATTRDTLEPAVIELPLSADPALRAKQLIQALITQAPDPARRTLPADTNLLQFYLLSDGTAVADFSDALATETPSGILSEQLAVNSIVSTLAANVASIRRLKILIHGQETDTLAGHVDLTGFFTVSTAPPPSAPGIPITPGIPIRPRPITPGGVTILKHQSTPPTHAPGTQGAAPPKSAAPATPTPPPPPEPKKP